MKYILPVLLLILPLALHAAEPTPPRPNILYLLADDLGYGELGFQGCQDVPTPNLDSLGEGGVRFTNGYVSSPVCSPSRAGLLTGRYQTRFGHEFNHPLADRAPIGLPVEQKTAADWFKEAGYATAHIGKWHLGNSQLPKYTATARGFDLDVLSPGQNKLPPLIAWRNGKRETPDDAYVDSAMGREAATYIESHQTEPWFLYVAYLTPHVPLQTPPGSEDPFAKIADEKRRKNAAMISLLDQSVGRILKALRDSGQEERTLIVFHSDNGAPFGSGSNNTPLRGFKSTLREGGIRIPFVMQWKGTLPAGRIEKSPVISLDLLPTALAAAKVDLPKDAKLDGVNLLPYLTGKTDALPRRNLFWRYGDQYAVRQGDWKLVQSMDQVAKPPVLKTGLYNLASDAAEEHDLSAEHPEKVKALKALWDEWNTQNVPALWDSETKPEMPPVGAVNPKKMRETATQLGAEATAESALKVDPTALKQWQDNRFGMFIHWGPVSLSGERISWSRGAPTPIAEYDALYEKFSAPKFDADAWASIAKRAGMKYVVLTTKHHDGFCLWDTKQTNYNVMNSPLKRDVVKELSEACRKQGLGFGVYYSVCDWHHPDFPRTGIGGRDLREKSDIESYRRFLRAQVTELVQNYGPLQVMWFDVPQEFDRDQGLENVRLCRSLQPKILVNDRAGGKKGDLAGDFSTPERHIGDFNLDRPWESCMTLGNSWSWKSNDQIKPLAECLQSLVRTAGGDGNLLLNVGPMPDGRIEPRQADRLREMGEWLEKYGASVYGTRGGPYRPAKHVVATRAGNLVYLHILDWPEETLRLPALPAKIVSSRVLTGGQTVVAVDTQGIEIRVPASDRSNIDTIVVLELDKPAMEIAPIPVASLFQPLTEGKPSTASHVRDVSGNVRRYAADKANDGDEHTRWATDQSTRECWLEVDLGKVEKFDHAVIHEVGKNVQAFELQMKDGEGWKTFEQGKTLGPEFEIRFSPIAARQVRLSITAASGAPSVAEFQLFAPNPIAKSQ